MPEAAARPKMAFLEPAVRDSTSLVVFLEDGFALVNRAGMAPQQGEFRFAPTSEVGRSFAAEDRPTELGTTAVVPMLVG